MNSHKLMGVLRANTGAIGCIGLSSVGAKKKLTVPDSTIVAPIMLLGQKVFMA